jgi:hypothetical protein
LCRKGDKLKIFIKEYLPLVSLVKSKLETSSGNGGADGSVVPESKEKSAAKALEKAMELIRAEYDGEIIFIYHSQTIVLEDGSIAFAEDKLFDVFKKACDDNNIRVVDMRPVFVEYYTKETKLPYGFANTKPGNGHLNKLGHKLVAESLIPCIEEVMA